VQPEYPNTVTFGDTEIQYRVIKGGYVARMDDTYKFYFPNYNEMEKFFLRGEHKPYQHKKECE